VRRQTTRVVGRAIAVLLVALVTWIGSRLKDAPTGSAGSGGSENGSADAASFEHALEHRSSGVMITTEGRIKKLLPDDTRGDRHQRILMDMGRGRTLLVVHNIDLAPRIPGHRGDRLKVRGEFEWNDRGGLVHWTHHDPGGRRPGGWVEHDGKTYR